MFPAEGFFYLSCVQRIGSCQRDKEQNVPYLCIAKRVAGRAVKGNCFGIFRIENANGYLKNSSTQCIIDLEVIKR